MTQTISLAALAVGPAPTGSGDYGTAMTGMAGMTEMTGTPWTGVLAVEGIETGDQREFADQALTWADPPLPLRWNIVDSHGGEQTTQTVLVGRIDQLWRDAQRPNYIMGSGIFDDQGDYGSQALRLVRDGFLSGVSIDPDSITEADVELVFPEDTTDGGADDGDPLDALFQMPELTRFHAGRIRAATLVDIPAFAEAKIWLTDQAATAPPAVAASAHFVALSRARWQGALFDQILSRRGLSADRARQAFAFVAPVGTGPLSARFLHHELTEETVGPANLTAVTAALHSLNSGRAETLTPQQRLAAYAHLADHLRTAGIEVPPLEDAGTELVAGAFSHLLAPPAAWFTDPQLPTLTPLTITDEGRVFGHGAGWGTCHTAFPGACTQPPVEGTHDYYRLGEVVTAEGVRVPVGSITLGTGHASTARGLSPIQAAEHYDHTGTAVALVASGEDDHGIWVAGALRPDVTPERVVELRASSLSGDWRRIGGKLRLVAFLAVNRPGFPVPRTSAYMHAGAQLSLVASGVVTQDMRRPDDSIARAALAHIARSMGRTPDARWAELRTRVGR